MQEEALHEQRAHVGVELVGALLRRAEPHVVALVVGDHHEVRGRVGAQEGLVLREAGDRDVEQVVRIDRAVDEHVA